MRRTLTKAIVASIVAVAALLPACSGSPDRPSGTTPGGEPAAEPSEPARLWRSDGYGWIVRVAGGRAQTFETTAISCLPRRPLDRVDERRTDGATSYGRDGIASQIIRPGPNDTATLRLLGTAADIDLLPVTELPAECSREPKDDPLTTFDVFWTTFAENYNSFARKNVDWPAVRDRYRPGINAGTSDEDLYKILTEMVQPLGDAHVSLEGPEDEEFSGSRAGTREEIPIRRTTAAIDDHLRQNLGVSDIRVFAGGAIAYADLPGGRGYLRINRFEEYDEDDDSYLASAAALTRILDTVFTQARVSTLRGLIIDVRLNSGGDDELGLQVAARLTNTPYPAFTKQPRNDPGDLTRHGPMRTVTVTPADRPRYTGPIRLLISDQTISAGETFVMALMGRDPAPGRVGANTQGVFADDMGRKLPNGWSFRLGNEDYYGPDGRNYEGVGVPPTIPTPVFTPEELAQNRDSALDAPW